MELRKMSKAWVCAIVALLCVCFATIGMAQGLTGTEPHDDPETTAWNQARGRMLRTLDAGRQPVPQVISLDLSGTTGATGETNFTWGMSRLDTQRILGVALMPMAAPSQAPNGRIAQTFAPSYDEYTLFKVNNQLALGAFEFEDDQLIAVTLTVLTDHPGMKNTDPGALYTAVAAAVEQEQGTTLASSRYASTRSMEAVTVVSANTSGWQALSADTTQSAVRVAVTEAYLVAIAATDTQIDEG